MVWLRGKSQLGRTGVGIVLRTFRLSQRSTKWVTAARSRNFESIITQERFTSQSRLLGNLIYRLSGKSESGIAWQFRKSRKLGILGTVWKVCSSRLFEISRPGNVSILDFFLPSQSRTHRNTFSAFLNNISQKGKGRKKKHSKLLILRWNSLHFWYNLFTQVWTSKSEIIIIIMTFCPKVGLWSHLKVPGQCELMVVYHYLPSDEDYIQRETHSSKTNHLYLYRVSNSGPFDCKAVSFTTSGGSCI